MDQTGDGTGRCGAGGRGRVLPLPGISLRHSPRLGCAHICVMILRRRRRGEGERAAVTVEREKSDMWRRMMDELQVRSESGTLRSPERGRSGFAWENCFGIIEHRAQIFLIIFTQLFKHAHQAVPSSALILWLKAPPCNMVIKQA